MTNKLSDAISAIDAMCDVFGLSSFDITEYDAQGSILGLHFAIADVLAYSRDMADDFDEMVRCSDTLVLWQFRQNGSAWEPREGFAEGEYADDYDQYEREDLYANCSVAQLIELGDLCDAGMVAVRNAGRDY